MAVLESESIPGLNMSNYHVDHSVREAIHVAVVVPVRNRPDLLEECLCSLAKRDFRLNECAILICDDGSTEDLRSVVEKFNGTIPNLQMLKQPPKGPAEARNLGFRTSLARIFVCIDSDVVCKEDFLRRIVGALESNRHWVAAEGGRGSGWNGPI